MVNARLVLVSACCVAAAVWAQTPKLNFPPMKAYTGAVAHSIDPLEGEVLETEECQNGAAGQIGIFEGFGTISVAGTFGRISDCGSRITYSTLPIGGCSARLLTTTATLRPSEASPSPTTPVISYLDAGPSIKVRGPEREVESLRLISGPLTTYQFSEQRSPSIDELLSGISNQSLVKPGKYSISAEGGRDIPAFQAEFDFEPMLITRPTRAAPVSASQPPTIEWSGGASVKERMDLQIQLSANDPRRRYQVVCRLRDGTAGAFTIPDSTWSQVPAEFRTAGTMSVTLSVASAHVTIPVPNVDGGLRVVMQQTPAAVTQVIP